MSETKYIFARQARPGFTPWGNEAPVTANNLQSTIDNLQSP